MTTIVLNIRKLNSLIPFIRRGSSAQYTKELFVILAFNDPSNTIVQIYRHQFATGPLEIDIPENLWSFPFDVYGVRPSTKEVCFSAESLSLVNEQGQWVRSPLFNEPGALINQLYIYMVDDWVELAQKARKRLSEIPGRFVDIESAFEPVSFEIFSSEFWQSNLSFEQGGWGGRQISEILGENKANGGIASVDYEGSGLGVDLEILKPNENRHGSARYTIKYVYERDAQSFSWLGEDVISYRAPLLEHSDMQLTRKGLNSFSGSNKDALEALIAESLSTLSGEIQREHGRNASTIRNLWTSLLETIPEHRFRRIQNYPILFSARAAKRTTMKSTFLVTNWVQAKTYRPVLKGCIAEFDAAFSNDRNQRN